MAETLSNKKGNKKDNKKGKKSNLSSQTTGGDFPFLSLPAEIRLMIYYEIRLPSNIHLPRPRLPASVKALLRINGIRSELLVLMGQKCHFHRRRAKYYRSVMSSSLPTWSAFVKYALPHTKKLSLTVPSFFCGWHWLMNRELSEILRSLRVRQLDRHRDKPLPWNLQHLTIMEAIRSGHSWEHVPTASSPHTEATRLGAIRAKLPKSLDSGVDVHWYTAAQTQEISFQAATKHSEPLTSWELVHAPNERKPYKGPTRSVILDRVV